MRRPARQPVLNLGSGAPLAAEARHPLINRAGKHLRGIFDRMIASSSLVANDAVLDVRDFAWTAGLREHWVAIRDEVVQVAAQDGAQDRGQDGVPTGLATISPDHHAITGIDTGHSFLLYGYGHPIDESLARCPRTAAALAHVPRLHAAWFSILAPGTHIPEHRGVTKGLITCHLGLIVPRDGDVRMRVHDRVVRWAEGETLVFDDTYRHEVWNDTRGTRVVLMIQFERPLRNPGKWIADVVLGIVRRAAPARSSR